MTDLRQLRALRAVAASGSFSRAAEELSYTQSAVSKTIAALEAELGAVLVEREHRPVRLTDAGAALVRHADAVFAQLASARAEVEAIAAGRAGSLAVGTFGSAASAFVVQAVCDFRAARPGVHVSLVEGSPGELVRALRAGELDVAAIYDHPGAGEDLTEGLEVRAVVDQPFDAVLPAGHPLAGRERIDVRELADADWLLPDLGPGSAMMRAIRGAFDAAGFEPRVPFAVNDCHMTLAMVAVDGGVGILPRLMVEPLPAGVVVRPLAGPAPVQRIVAVRPPARYLSPACAAFLDVLERAAAERVRGWTTAAAAA